MKNGSANLARPEAADVARATPLFSRGQLVESSPQLDKERLREWILAKCSPDCRPQCVSFRLAHDQGGSLGLRHISDSADIPKKATQQERERFVDEVVKEFDETSRNTAYTYPRTQRFEVGAVPREAADIRVEDTPAKFTYSFLVTPPPDVAAAFHQSDPDGPSMTAVTGQLQRMNERLVSQLSSNLQADKDRYAQENQFLVDKVHLLLDRGYEQQLKMQELLDQQSMRAIQEHEKRLQLDTQHQLYGALIKYGGAILKKKFAPELEGENPLLEFARTLTPRQLAQFVASLDEEQQRKFGPMASALIEAMTPEQKLELQQAILSVNQPALDEEKK